MRDLGKRFGRRTILKAASIAPTIVYSSAVLAQKAQDRRTYVLVHGAWHGGWCWRRVADLLEEKGHKVYTPTLTGVADRSHLLSKSITLDTHILDVANLMEWEDLQNVVLCGHSYGGWPISGVAEKQQKRIGTIVYLDAFLPNNGQKVLDTNTPERKKSVLEGIEKGELARPGPSAAAFFVNEKDQAWVNAKTRLPSLSACRRNQSRLRAHAIGLQRRLTCARESIRSQTLIAGMSSAKRTRHGRSSI